MTERDAKVGTRKRVLVVDDEATIAEAISARLMNEGYEVTIAADGPSAVTLCESFRPDLVVLDIMLPGFDGYEVCRRIQKDRRIPVIMLTARTDEVDLLVGLSVGADDYMSKPFSPRELVARVHAVLRRVEDTPVVTPVNQEPSSLCFNDIMINVAERTVWVSQEQRHLTATEFDIAVWLLTHPRLVFSRGQLLQSIWGYTDIAGERTVDSHIQALRRKLEPSFVRTVHGVGYALGFPEEAS